MRNPERIHKILSMLEEFWVKHPDLRLGQILININTYFANKDENEDLSLFYLEDDKIIEGLKTFDNCLNDCQRLSTQNMFDTLTSKQKTWLMDELAKEYGIIDTGEEFSDNGVIRKWETFQLEDEDGFVYEGRYYLDTEEDVFDTLVVHQKENINID